VALITANEMVLTELAGMLDPGRCQHLRPRLESVAVKTMDPYGSFDAIAASDFLASPRVSETACLIADVHMPAMTGVELHKHLVDAGRAIPTILVTAHANNIK
jgi:CheY-like chemotaxis protein